MMSDIHVEAVAVTKIFERGLLSPGPRRFEALKGVDLQVPRGSMVGLVGESGSGKSTLARIMIGMDEPTGGTVRIDGVDASRVRGRERSAMRLKAQMVSQDPFGALDPLMSVGASLGEALAAAGVPSADRAARAAELLESVRLDPTLARRRPRELSGGQRQRIVIARALACSPSFIALDEPVSSLDVSVQAGVVDLLLDLKEARGLSYLFVSHDLDLVGAVCDRVAVMTAGRVVEFGDAREVAAAPRHEYTISLHRNGLGLVTAPLFRSAGAPAAESA